MKVISYLFVFLLFSLTTENGIPEDIRDIFFSKIKSVLDKRDSFNYKNNILFPADIIKKTFIIDSIDSDLKKVDEIGIRYNLESEAIEQIKVNFFQAEKVPSVYHDFDFSLDSPDLKQIVDSAIFTEYIGICFKQQQKNVINYIILRLTVKVQFKQKLNIKSKWCLRFPKSIIFQPFAILYKQIRELCRKNIDDPKCLPIRSRFDKNICPLKEDQVIISERRPLNDKESKEAEELVKAYTADVFRLKLEELDKTETIKLPDNLETQSIFFTGQIFKNPTYQMEAEITNYGDVEIRKSSYKNKVSMQNECESLTDPEYYDEHWECSYGLLCFERDNVYLIADQKSESTCTKLKELQKEKRDIKMVIYTDGSMAIIDEKSLGVLFYKKPDIAGKGPFNVDITKDFEIQVLDSRKIVVWKYAPVSTPTTWYRRTYGKN